MIRWRYAVRKSFTAAFIVAACSLSFINHSAAQTNYFAGKTIKVIVGFPPGGGYDLYARLIGAFLSKYIPGQPAVVVTNMPGAATLTMVNYIYNIAPKDGTEIGAPTPNILFTPIFKGPGVKFDPFKLTWIGNANKGDSDCVTYETSKVHKLADLLTTTATFGATGTGAPPFVEPRVLNATLGTKIKVVVGYPGNNELFLAMERGELDGICGFGYSALMATQGDWIKEGKLHFLAQNALVKNPSLPNVPLVIDFSKDDNQKNLFKLLAASHQVDKPYIAPSGIPSAQRDQLRHAFDMTMQDPDFLEKAKALNLDINPATGAEDEEIFKSIAGMDPSVIDEMIKLMN